MICLLYGNKLKIGELVLLFARKEYLRWVNLSLASVSNYPAK